MNVLLWIICVGVTFINAAVGLVNLAQNMEYRGNTSQSTVHIKNWAAADKAIDGHLEETDKDFCSITRSGKFMTAWWKFTLTQMSNVAYLQIFFRETTFNRHTEFNVFVFNKSSYVPPSIGGYKVFTQDPSTCPSRVMNITVNRVTKGIAIYNSKKPPLHTTCEEYEPSFATIEICEVMVMGCHFQQYGESCTPCSIKCLNQECDAFNGSCIYGCSDRFIEPPNCMICKGGYYGHNCERTCGKCKTGTTCNSITGICPNGCQGHWDGSNCDVCKRGFYGYNCEQTCGKCKPSTTCNNITGLCPNGCQDQWNGSNCDVCKNGFYDNNCTKTCGHCKPGTYCHNVTGVCQEGCDAYWKGTKCNVCKEGFYGKSCEKSCGSCVNGTFCDNITGKCPDGCQDHWNGTKCDVCDDGFYGFSCNKTCEYCTQNKCTKEEGHCLKENLSLESSTGRIIGGVITSLTILVFIVICTIIISRRRNMKKETKDKRNSTVISECHEGKEGNLSNTTGHSNQPLPEMSKLVIAGDCVYYNTNQISSDIKIEDLQNCIATKSAGENSLFLLEYKRLPFGDVNKCHTAKKKENITKNRFKTTFPYEQSRVILQEKWNKDDNDYINANYIRDLNGEKRFIATQGPQKNTITDFWRMIWQENIECVLMLTNLVENGKNKCKKYWPKKDRPMNIGPCKVSLLEETFYAFYTVRKFSTQRENSKTKRIISQFHYTAWPDHGTPEEIALLQFHRAVTKRYRPGTPLLVHCSAGVGRTGTYIGLNVLLKEGKETGRINVFEFIEQMREDRMTMVQTVEQYVFLHKALLCGFQDIETVIPEGGLQENVLTLLKDTSPFNQQQLKKEFQLIAALRPVCDTESKKDAVKPENRAKNVDMDILSVSKYRPYLTSYVKGRNDYINAVIVPTFTNPHGIIVTQKPLPDTEVDMWRLCRDHAIDSVVVLNDDDLGNSWLPKRGATQKCQRFTITARNTGFDIDGVQQDDLLISHNDHKSRIELFQIPSGNDNAFLKGTKMLLEKEKMSMSTSLVISSNGAGPAGIFCVLHNALQQLRMDGEVDLFTTVRQIQTRRPEVITTLEEYRKCYQLLCSSVSSEGIYMNF